MDEHGKHGRERHVGTFNEQSRVYEKGIFACQRQMPKLKIFMRNQCAHLLSGGFLRVWGCVKARLLRVRSMGRGAAASEQLVTRRLAF